MIGFEVEIDLRVTTLAGKVLKGDTRLARSSVVGEFELVSDHRLLRNRDPYSNLEFVTTAKPAVGPNAATAFGVLNALLGRVRLVRDELYAAGAVTLPDASANLVMLDAGIDARLAPGVGYVERAGLDGYGDALYLHYSVGVPLGGISVFFDRLRSNAGAPYAPNAYLPLARYRLVQAKRFADAAMKIFEDEGFDMDVDTQPLHGYLQLVYTQISAMADFLALRAENEQIKNDTVVLSRSSLSEEVYPLLGKDLQDCLQWGFKAKPQAKNLVTLLKRFQGQDNNGAAVDFGDDSTRTTENQTISLIDYTRSAMTGEPEVYQQTVFGGMNQIPPHKEGGKMLVPMELRTLGTPYKTWQGIASDLQNLCTWCEEAYQAA